MQDVPYSSNYTVKFPSISDDIKAIVSTALLITGNTVGTGTLVLPDPGLAALHGRSSLSQIGSDRTGLYIAQESMTELAGSVLHQFAPAHERYCATEKVGNAPARRQQYLEVSLLLSTDPFVIVDSCAPCDRCFLDQSHFRFGGC